jgi:alpha-1,3-rhamnosyltransferase
MPLVSVVIVTYNHEKFILECLESVYIQTYNEIELVVSDDCSSDKTISLVYDWTAKNAHRFKRISVIENTQNLGISGNYTKASRAATGTYVKHLGGDDILSSEAIATFVDFSLKNNALWCMSDIMRFFDSPSDYEIIKPSGFNTRILRNATVKKQLVHLLANNYILTPGVFMRREILEEVGYFGGSYRTKEDYHTYIRIMVQGYRLMYLPKPMVYWRRHEDAVSYTASPEIINRYYLEDLRIAREYRLPNISYWNIFIRIQVLVSMLEKKILIKWPGISEKKVKYLYLLSPYRIAVLLYNQIFSLLL